MLTRRRVLLGGAASAGLAAAQFLGMTAQTSGTPTPTRQKPPTAAWFDVISDIQGDLADLDRALDGLAAFGPADALLVNGDLTPNGRLDEYEQLFRRLERTAHPQTLYTIGNHEFYNDETSEVSIARFLRYSAMPALFSAHPIGGVPVIRLGTTDGSESRGHCVILGRTQLDWLRDTLEECPRERPVLVMSHHALPGTVSGTFTDPLTQAPRIYSSDYAESDDLLALLGGFPNVLLLSGHTHWSLYRDDWLSRKTVPGGHPDGFAAVNTGAVQIGFGPDGRGGEEPVDRKQNQGLRIEVDGPTVRIHALDFRRGAVIRTAEFRVGDGPDPALVASPGWPDASS
ncbi:metallophosphoesterase family protein [Rhodococcus daqingensis]|uniref:Metallophosphoesterase family protein n=1 Tax=Rhodococcus daqingensis TaxID=2479363 RepID=A0ABW2RUN3_9NOCA